MEKKTISVHAFTVHIYTIAIVLLVLLLGLLGLKYLHLKMSVSKFTNSTIWMNQQEQPTGFVSDYAVSIAQSFQFVPTAESQAYVSAVSKALSRDVVVVDNAQKILAGTVVANDGKIYTGDGTVIQMTISDGKVRQFEERNQNYPNGIMENVVPMKNAKGVTVGAVLVSGSTIQ
jgi:hypothetical protein